eukprot:scaffold132358_cov48-Phaeocystis_antarctica.AAC.2
MAARRPAMAVSGRALRPAPRRPLPSPMGGLGGGRAKGHACGGGGAGRHRLEGDAPLTRLLLEGVSGGIPLRPRRAGRAPWGAIVVVVVVLTVLLLHLLLLLVLRVLLPTRSRRLLTGKPSRAKGVGSGPRDAVARHTGLGTHVDDQAGRKRPLVPADPGDFAPQLAVLLQDLAAVCEA